MNGFLSQFLTSEIQMVLIALLVMLVVIYVLSIFWAVRDGFGACPETTRTDEIRRLRQLRISRRGGLRVVPELPYALEEPVPYVSPCS